MTLISRFRQTKQDAYSTIGLDSAGVLPLIPGGITYVTTLDSLPISNITEGDKVFVEENRRLYISPNGTGWYNVAYVTLSPTMSLDKSGIIQLSRQGDATVVTITASDSDGDVLTYSIESDGNLGGIATVSQDSSIFTFTPKNIDSLPQDYVDSTYVIFKATDGINTVTDNLSFNLQTHYYDSPITAYPLGHPTYTGFDRMGSSLAVAPNGLAVVTGDWENASFGTNRGTIYVHKRDSIGAPFLSGTDQTGLYSTLRTNANGGTDNDYMTAGGIDCNDSARIIVAGCHMDGGPSDTLSMSGCVVVHSWNTTNYGGQQIVRPDPAPAAGDEFGFGVSISSSTRPGECRFVAGAWKEDHSNLTDPGAIYVFRLESGGGTVGADQGSGMLLSQQGTGVQPYDAGGLYAYGTGFVQEARFNYREDGQWNGDSSVYNNIGMGQRPHISGNGMRVACGVERASAGRGEMFVWTRDSANGTSWSFEQKWYASGTQGNPNDDEYGRHVSMDYEGNLLVSGARYWDRNNGRGGKVWIHQRDSSAGTKWSEIATLEPPTRKGDIQFGISTKISGDGNWIIVGAPGDSAELHGGYSGGIYVYRRDSDTATNWSLDAVVHSPIRTDVANKAGQVGYGKYTGGSPHYGYCENIGIDSNGNVIAFGNGDGGGPLTEATNVDHGIAWAMKNKRI